MPTKLKVVVLFSGRGSNLAALLKHQNNYEIIGCVTDNPAAEGIKHCTEFSIPLVVVDPVANENSNPKIKQEVLNATQEFGPQVVALAGFMRIIPQSFLDLFPQTLNIHPSLLPKFPGLDTHKRALKAGERQHGCTVHLVDSGVDTGAKIAQAAVYCNPKLDNESDLASRVLVREHQLYPWVLNSIGSSDIVLNGLHPQYSDKAKSEAHKLGITLFTES